MDCSTIIVSYNTYDLTVEAVRSALDQGKGLRHEVIVVDNASPDGSAQRLADAFPQTECPALRVVASPVNLGFSGGNNRGAELASGRVLFFLNPDTVVHEGAIEQLVAFVDAHPEVGAVGPRVLNSDGTDQRSTWPFVSTRALVAQYLPVGDLLRGRDRRRDPAVPASQPSDVVKGCALALRRDLFDRVGGWDEAYFMYSEETELCWALHCLGFPSYFLREAVITHHGGQSTAEDYAAFSVRECQSTLQFLRRHAPRHVVLMNRLLGAAGFAGRSGLYAALARLRPEHAAGYRLRGDSARALWRWFAFEYA